MAILLLELTEDKRKGVQIYEKIQPEDPKASEVFDQKGGLETHVPLYLCMYIYTVYLIYSIHPTNKFTSIETALSKTGPTVPSWQVRGLVPS